MYYVPEDRAVLDIQNPDLIEPNLWDVPLEEITNTEDRILKLKQMTKNEINHTFDYTKDKTVKARLKTIS